MQRSRAITGHLLRIILTQLGLFPEQQPLHWRRRGDPSPLSGRRSIGEERGLPAGDKRRPDSTLGIVEAEGGCVRELAKQLPGHGQLQVLHGYDALRCHLRLLDPAIATKKGDGVEGEK